MQHFKSRIMYGCMSLQHSMLWKEKSVGHWDSVSGQQGAVVYSNMPMQLLMSWLCVGHQDPVLY